MTEDMEGPEAAAFDSAFLYKVCFLVSQVPVSSGRALEGKAFITLAEKGQTESPVCKRGICESKAGGIHGLL